MTPEFPVALARIGNYQQAEEAVPALLEKAGIRVASGERVLVKPNLLIALPLACSNPLLVAAICKTLLDCGAKVIVADSPGFGSASHVANSIGLNQALKPLGLETLPMAKPRRVQLALKEKSGKPVSIAISSTALDCDRLLSVCRIKAHAQLRLTLSVKNCFGCVPGIRKAIAHTRFGQSTEAFADFLAAVWQALPSVAGVVDGIVAMSGKGPRDGRPVHLNLLAASGCAPAVDNAVIMALGEPLDRIPLAAALSRRGILPELSFPMKKPEDFDTTGFKLPERLAPASFNPARLAWSVCKRLWQGVKR